MYRLLLALLVIFKTPSLFSQCPPGSAILVTQAEVDQFIIDYPNCTMINGNLWIGSNSPTDITDLSALSNLNTVMFELLLRN